MKKLLAFGASAVLSAALLAGAGLPPEGKAKGKKVAAGNVEKGKEVFEQCAACHSADTDDKKMGPSLKGLYKKAKLHNGKKVTDATVKEIINKGGNGMPAYEELLTEEERNDLMAYLHTL